MRSRLTKTLRFVEKPVENSDREVKRRAKLLAVRYLVKVSWNSKCNFELTWVWEDYLKDKMGYYDNHDLSRFDNQSIERDRLIGIGFVLDFVEFISFTFGDKEMISVIEAIRIGTDLKFDFLEYLCMLMASFEDHEEVDINKKTENQAKMTKLSMEWKRLCKIKAKVQKCQSQSQYRRISSQTGAGTEEYYWMQS
ncbi:hypothetical protein Tco_0146496 [Tanacetum coccineum]